MIIYPIILFAVTFIADRLTKLWALAALAGDTVLQPFYGLNLVLRINRGVSWSLLSFSDERGFWILTTVIIAIITGFFIYVVREAARNKLVVFEALVLAGALSNVIDRFMYGGVVDFIELYVGTYSWPVFNIADTAICVGIAGILWRAWVVEFRA